MCILEGRFTLKFQIEAFLDFLSYLLNPRVGHLLIPYRGEFSNSISIQKYFLCMGDWEIKMKKFLFFD